MSSSSRGRDSSERRRAAAARTSQLSWPPALAEKGERPVDRLRASRCARRRTLRPSAGPSALCFAWVDASKIKLDARRVFNRLAHGRVDHVDRGLVDAAVTLTKPASLRASVMSRTPVAPSSQSKREDVPTATGIRRRRWRSGSAASIRCPPVPRAAPQWLQSVMKRDSFCSAAGSRDAGATAGGAISGDNGLSPAANARLGSAASGCALASGAGLSATPE